MEIYLVGGAVRDEILGIKSYDKDYLVVGATPEDMLKAGFEPVGKDFPVFLHPKTKSEYALARTERKIGKGYKGFIFYSDTKVTIEEDLLRRDFSINALAKDKEGKIIDFYGGIDDLNQRILRHTSAAFVEDPLRVLRLARFYAKFYYLGFKVAPSTLDLARKIVKAGEIEFLTKERVWQETHKALLTKNPAKYFQLLADIGALEILAPDLNEFYQNSTGALADDLHQKKQKPTGALAAIDEFAHKASPELIFARLVAPLKLAQIKQLLTDFKAPNIFLKYAQVAHWVLQFETANDFSSEAILTLCANTDFWRNPAVLIEVLNSYELNKLSQLVQELKKLDLNHITQNSKLEGKLIAQAIFSYRKDHLDLLIKK